MSLTSPVTLMMLDQSADPVDRLVAAGQRLSNMAYHAGANGLPVEREKWQQGYQAWDAAIAYAGPRLRPKEQP